MASFARVSKQTTPTRAPGASPLGVDSGAVGEGRGGARGQVARRGWDKGKTAPQLADADDQRARGNVGAADDVYRQILDQDPDNGEAHLGLAMVLLTVGRPELAMPHFVKACAATPASHASHHGLGMGLRALGRVEEAASAFRRALALEAASPASLAGLGSCLKFLGRFEESVEYLKQVVHYLPNSPGDWSNLGVTYKEWGRFREAIDCLVRALDLSPDHAELHFNLGNIFLSAGLYSAAALSFNDAVERDPRHVRAFTNLGVAYREQGRLEDAIACFSTAIDLNPAYVDAHWNRSLALLMSGDYAAGWAGYEWRRVLPRFAVRRLAQPEWDGSVLAGRTLLIHTEQGLGDTVQFLRYIGLVRERCIDASGGQIHVECSAALIPLLSHSAIDELCIAGDGQADCDVQAPLMSLPGLLEPDPAKAAYLIPYLGADPSLTRLWADRLSAYPGMRIGVCWQGNPDYAADQRRSIPLGAFAPISRLRGVHLVSLQKMPDASPLPVERGVALIDPGADFDASHGAFMDSAAVMANLDLVITVDTAVAHLAGALGVETWLLLADVPDWRWGLSGETTPWYPSLRLFRQPSAGDWPSVFAQILQQLSDRVSP